MSSFGSSGAASALFIAGLLAIPTFGWPVFLGMCALAVGYSILLGGANQAYYPDGQRRPQQRRR